MSADRLSTPMPDLPLAPFRWLAGLGLLGFVAGAVVDLERTWANLLLAGLFVLGLGLGGLYFVAIHYAAGAGWAAAFRRIPEAMMGLVPVGSVLVLAAVFGGGHSLYSWMDADHAYDGFKGAWLTPGFFYLRSLAYVVIFCLFAWAIGKNSRLQDEQPRSGFWSRNRRLSAIFLLVGSVALTLASIDWLMALEPLWFSTMWGVYQFSGLFVAALAAILLVAGWLEHHGCQLLTKSHLHDLGKLLFGMSTFWMYIWFSQMMLIWYANISEEAVHYTERLALGWGPMMIATVLLGWVVPFFFLMPLAAKLNFVVVRRVAIVVFVSHAADLMVQIHPPVTGAAPVVAWSELGALALVVAALFLVVGRRLGASPLVPHGDPYLQQSYHYHS